MGSLHYMLFLALAMVNYVAGQELYALPLNHGIGQWRDTGMCCGIDPDLSIFSPDKPSGTVLSWYDLGHRAQPDHNSNVNFPIHMFAEISPSLEPALVAPEGFTWIWDDSLTTSFNDGSAWRANCPANYSAVGDFFYPANDVNDPVNLYSNVRCIRSNLVEDCTFQPGATWTSEGSTGLHRGSVWDVVYTGDILKTDFLFVNKGFEMPPLTPKCVKLSAVLQLYYNKETGAVEYKGASVSL